MIKNQYYSNNNRIFGQLLITILKKSAKIDIYNFKKLLNYCAVYPYMLCHTQIKMM